MAANMTVMLPYPTVDYQLAVPNMAPEIYCPVKGCPGRANNNLNLRMHFMHRHVEDKI